MMIDSRIGFYPCCGRDIQVPLVILRDYVDHVVFCDNSPSIRKYYEKLNTTSPGSGPSSRMRFGRAHDVIMGMQRIDVLFYRCDSMGEGGSGAMLLGNRFLQQILDRMPLTGGLIITDGSNSRQSNFERMGRPGGVKKFGWHLQPHPVIPEIMPQDGRSYRNGVLKVIWATPIIGENGPPPHFDPCSIYF